MCEALPPGAALMSKICSFSWGANAITGNILDAACQWEYLKFVQSYINRVTKSRKINMVCVTHINVYEKSDYLMELYEKQN